MLEGAVGPSVGPEEEVPLFIGNGAGEDGTSVGTEGIPVPRGGDGNTAVPVPSK